MATSILYAPRKTRMTVSESQGARVDVPDVHDVANLTSLQGVTAPDGMEGGMGVLLPYAYYFE